MNSRRRARCTASVAWALSACLSSSVWGCAKGEDESSLDGGTGGRSTGGTTVDGRDSGAGGESAGGGEGTGTTGFSGGGSSSSAHGPGDPCGGPYGACNPGSSCRSMAIYECIRASRGACPDPELTGYCYPVDVAGCLRGDGNFPFCNSGFSPLGASKADETCCAPLGNQGAFACKVPDGTTPGCETCVELTGDQYSPASCEGGVCGRSLATNVMPIPAHVSDDSSIYWQNRDSEILALDLAGAGAPRVLASDPGYLSALATDGKHLYLGTRYNVEDGGTGISRISVGGGELESFAPAGSVEVQKSMFVAGERLYWQSPERRLAFKPVAGGAESVVGLLEVSTVAPGATSVFAYATDAPGTQSTIWRVPIGENAPAYFADAYPEHLAVDESNLYSVESTSSQCGWIYGVVKRPLDGSASVTLTRTKKQITGLVVRAGAVYYTTVDAIVRVGLDGGPVTAVAATSGRDLMARGRSLYWVDRDETLFTLDVD